MSMQMKYGNVPGIEKPISRLVQGTATYDTSKPDDVLASLDTAFELGYTCFDTAQVYGPDKEKLFGQWVRERGLRDKVVILAKGAHHSGARQRVTPEDITEDMTNTLAHMELDYLDLYVLHRDNPAVPVGPIVEVLNEHKRDGRIGAFGGSNWSLERIREANAYAHEHGLTPFAISSPNFSLAEQVKAPWENCITISGPQNEAVREGYAADGTALFTWSSLAGGFWSGRFRRDNLDSPEFNNYWDKLCVECYCVEPNFQRLDRADELAAQKGVTVTQIALAWVMSQPLNEFALCFSADRAQFEANVAALNIELTPHELAYLDLKA